MKSEICFEVLHDEFYAIRSDDMLAGILRHTVVDDEPSLSN